MSEAPPHLLLTADAVGGVWQYATDLAGALTQHGYRATIALLGPAPTADQRAGVPAGVALVETGLPLDWLCDGPVPVLAAGRAVAALAGDVGADLVQLNMPTLGAEAAFPVPTLAVTHGCLATWWAAARGTALPPDYAWARRLTSAGLRAADLVVAPTRAYAEVVRREYRLRARPHAVHNGRRPLVAEGVEGWPVFTAGRLWDQVKNTHLLDRVAARIGVPFAAAGAARGPHGEAVALDHLHPLGHVDEARLARILAGRPVFVSAARFEPFGLAVLEAALAGCPLVLSDIPTFRELWAGAALFVAPDDEAGFAAAVDALLADPVRAQAAGDRARAAAARYSVAACAAEMAALYAGLLPARAAAA